MEKTKPRSSLVGQPVWWAIIGAATMPKLLVGGDGLTRPAASHE
jgi:hypothetical protein